MILLALALACDPRNPAREAIAAAEEACAPAPAATFSCPMHPEVVSDHPDTCPKCGMDLVKEE